MDTYSRARRGIALGASGLLVAGATVAMTTATTTSANAGKVNKNYAYSCVGVEPIPLPAQSVRIKTRLTLPNAARAGQKVRKRTARLQLRMPNSLRDTDTSALGATEAEGSSDDAAMGLKIGKKTRRVKVRNLSAPRAAIPTDKRWVIKTKGKLNAFKIPANARAGTKARLSMPKSFTVTATLYDADGNPTAAKLKCDASGKRALGTIKIRKAPSRLRVNVKPKRIIAKKTRARVHVKVRSTGKATGKVRVKQGKRVLGTAKLRAGKTTVRLKRFAKPGKHRLTIKYAGNKSVKASTAKRTVRVRR
ncbi:MAG: Ig-like domain-containing protein [Actinomycetia bacterium]|nr:Ig-like domain-containing protein [Actinomycetes bacterium]